MAKSEEDRTEKKRMFSRSRNYVYSRFRPGDVAENSRAAISEGARSVMSALSPRRAEKGELREGYRGRYEDGGRTRFAEMCHEMGLTSQDLIQIRAGHLKFRNLYGGAAALSFAFGMALLLTAGNGIGIMAGAALAMFTLIFGGLALRGDYSAWQIAHRRFGGLHDYFENRNARISTGTSAVAARPTDAAPPARKAHGPKVGG